MTYPKALVFGLLAGLGIWVGLATSRNTGVAEAAPYAAGAGVVISLALCALASYKNGRPPRR